MTEGISEQAHSTPGAEQSTGKPASKGRPRGRDEWPFQRNAKTGQFSRQQGRGSRAVMQAAEQSGLLRREKAAGSAVG